MRSVGDRLRAQCPRYEAIWYPLVAYGGAALGLALVLVALAAWRAPGERLV